MGKKSIDWEKEIVSDSIGQKGLVSVVIPTYNRNKIIKDTLESVRDQTYRPIELIVVDDGSTDGTESFIREWEESIKPGSSLFFHYFYQENQGQAAARNFGILRSRGEYIQYLDSDDLLHPNKIEKQMHVACSYPGFILCGPWRHVRELKEVNILKEASDLLDLNQDIIDQWLHGYYFAPHALLWPRSVVMSIGPWDESLVRELDGDYFLKAVLNGFRFKYVQGAWSFYRQLPSEYRQESHTASLDAAESREKVVRRLMIALREKGLFEKYRKSLSAWFYYAAKVYAGAQPEFAEKCFKQSRKLYKNPDIPQNRFSYWIQRLSSKNPKNDYFDLKSKYIFEDRWHKFVDAYQRKSFGKAFLFLLLSLSNHPKRTLKRILKKR